MYCWGACSTSCVRDAGRAHEFLDVASAKPGPANPNRLPVLGWEVRYRGVRDAQATLLAQQQLPGGTDDPRPFFVHRG